MTKTAAKTIRRALTMKSPGVWASHSGKWTVTRQGKRWAIWAVKTNEVTEMAPSLAAAARGILRFEGKLPLLRG